MEYCVYELRAGDWFYYGTSCRPERRLIRHREEMRDRLRDPEASIRGGGRKKKPRHWLEALQQHPPRKWKLTIYHRLTDREDAEFEEEQLIQAHRGNPYLLNRSMRADGACPELVVAYHETKKAYEGHEVPRVSQAQKCRNLPLKNFLV